MSINAYWNVKDAALKQQLLALFGYISDVSTNSIRKICSRVTTSSRTRQRNV